MQITTEQIKNLRDETGVSVMQCKKALEEAGGDMEKSRIILRKISKQSADKKSERTLGSGIIASYIHGNGSVGAMMELLCESDFVARNEEFKVLAKDIAMHITALAPEYLRIEDVKEEDKDEEKVLLEQAFIKNPEINIRALIEQAIQKFGERIEIGRFVRFSIN
jgi:elongation factor Ts